MAGKAMSRNCRLCVELGFCKEDDPDPKHSGTLLHRIWTCPALEKHRRAMVPHGLLEDVKKAMRRDGTMSSEDLFLYTRALVASPEGQVEQPPSEETFHW
eukprot:197806-Karenia_brevis.AAC.1